MSDPVAHPSHYNHGEIEVIDAITDWGLGFDLGNAVKYIARAEHKDNELQDLEKAAWYLEHRISQVKLTIEKNDETLARSRAVSNGPGEHKPFIG